jgi:hypothetical protein
MSDSLSKIQRNGTWLQDRKKSQFVVVVEAKTCRPRARLCPTRGCGSCAGFMTDRWQTKSVPNSYKGLGRNREWNYLFTAGRYARSKTLMRVTARLNRYKSEKEGVDGLGRRAMDLVPTNRYCCLKITLHYLTKLALFSVTHEAIGD